MGTFGDKFRTARESKDLSFDDISNVTKISSRMLKAIEEERFDLLPGGVFNKGFIRAYAKHLGLNDEEAVSAYLICLREAQVDAHEVWEPERPAIPVRTITGIAGRNAPPAIAPEPVKRPLPYDKPSLTSLPPVRVEDPQDAHPRDAGPKHAELDHLQLPRAEDARPPRRDFPDSRSPAIPRSLLALAIVIFALAAFLWIRHNRARHSATTTATPTTANAAVTTPVGSPVAAASNPQPAAPKSTSLSALRPSQTQSTSTPSSAFTASQPAPAKGATANPVPAKSAQNQAAQNSNAAKPATAPAKAPGQKPSVIVKGDVTIRNFANANSAPSAKPVTSLALVIRANENCWVSVLADGQLVTEETLIAPAATTVHASHEIVAHVGNAAAVSFFFNGKEVSIPGSDGSDGQGRTYTFDAQGMHEGPPPAVPTDR